MYWGIILVELIFSCTQFCIYCDPLSSTFSKWIFFCVLTDVYILKCRQDHLIEMITTCVLLILRVRCDWCARFLCMLFNCAATTCQQMPEEGLWPKRCINKNQSCYKCRRCAGHYVLFVHSLEDVYPCLHTRPNSPGVHKTLLPKINTSK